MDFFEGVEEGTPLHVYGFRIRIGSIKSIDKRFQMQEVELTLTDCIRERTAGSTG